VLLAGSAAGVTAVHAQPYVGWQQLTERFPATPGGVVGGSAIQDVSVSPDGSKIAFAAFWNFTGQNTNGSQEIFVFDSVTGEISQATFREGPSTGGTAIFTPQFAPDNDTIVFRAGWNFPTNPDTGTNTSVQAWEVRTSTGEFRRITNFMPNIVSEVRLSADGNKVSFHSTASLAGRNELFIIDRNSLVRQQLTTHVGGFPDAPRLSADGSVIVFDSAGNFDGTNTNGSIEFWKVTPTDGVISAVTFNTSGGTPAFRVSDAPSKSTALDHAGRWLCSMGSWNPFGSAGATNLFLYDLATSPPTVSQITTGNGTILGPVISGDGRLIAFESNRTALPGAPNTDGNKELFIYDRVAGTFTNSTQSTGGVSISGKSDAASINFASISADGKWIAYSTDASLEQDVVNIGGAFELYYGFISDTAAPQIGRGPVAALSLTGGEQLKLRVYAAGEGPLNYQWMRDGVPLFDEAAAGGGVIGGATSPRLSITPVGAADTGIYTCTVTGPAGTITSSESVVTVVAPSAACSLADIVGGDGNPPADANVDGNDFQAFLNAFGSGETLADIVGGDGNPPADGSADGNDFQAFLNAFAVGC